MFPCPVLERTCFDTGKCWGPARGTQEGVRWRQRSQRADGMDDEDTDPVQAESCKNSVRRDGRMDSYQDPPERSLKAVVGPQRLALSSQKALVGIQTLIPPRRRADDRGSRADLEECERHISNAHPDP